ncbi:MAG: adenylyl-sulfate kinase [Candidatus Eremiobacteraeota bacterium]|nr:adenylyl-sulfate kinase [Candidatus Eremiobacteraeota bacterium]
MNDVLTTVFLGHVDHGKSTLVARLMLDSGAFPDGRIEELRAASKKRGVPLEISFLLDALQIERDQAVTIDASRLWLTTPHRTFAIVDAPGHKEFVRHMVTGASEAGAAVVLVEARQGVSEQTRRHLLLLSLLNVGRVVVAVNKMDLVDFAAECFETIALEVKSILGHLKLEFCGAVPVVARDGDNVVNESTRMQWYKGPTLLHLLKELPFQADVARPVRIPIQDIYRRGEERLLVGTVQGDGLKAGTHLVVLPSRYAAVVQRLVRFPENSARAARSGEAVCIVLDRPLYVEPGDVACAPDQAPNVVSQLDVTVFWLSACGLYVGDRVQARIGTRDVQASVHSIEGKIDVDTLQVQPTASLQDGDIAQARLLFESPAIVERNPGSVLSRIALYRDGIVCGGAVVTALLDETHGRQSSSNVVLESGLVNADARQRRNGHLGGVVWLTGLPSSGKSTLGKRLEQRLYALGWSVYFLDGDTLRTGLNGDLGFNSEARRENVRRTGEVAALFSDAGFIAIVGLVSPSRNDRETARQACKGDFSEVYVRATLQTCEQRDPKGLYKRARSGEIADFTGISAPYEPPDHPELLVDTTVHGADASSEQLLAFVRARYEIAVKLATRA